MNILTDLLLVVTSLFLGFFLANMRKKRKNVLADPPLSVPLQNVAVATKSALEEKMMMEETISIIEKLSETISSSYNLKELADKITKTTCRILNVEICALLLLDDETQTLNIIASKGIEDRIANNTFIKLGEEISGAVAQVNEITIINNLERQRPSYSLIYDYCYKNSLISIPLTAKNKVLGVLNISNRRNNAPFSPMDVEIAKIIALESAIALQNFKLLEEQNKNYLNTIFALASAVDARDPYTYQHSRNVTEYSVRIAKEMQLSGRFIEDIKQAALLHDIGKIAVRDAVLAKPGKLTEDEFAQIKIHPVRGEEIIKSLPFLKEISKMIRHHHERFDGKGYPDGLASENIELGARILTVADSFDAMTTDRPYRKALSLEEAKNELNRNKFTQFDPLITDCFMRILENDPHLLNHSRFSL